MTAPAPPFPNAAFGVPRPRSGHSGAGKSLEICADSEHHPRYDEDGAHPRHGGKGCGEVLDEPFSAGSSGALRHLPCKGPAALAHSPALNGGEKGGRVVDSVCCGVHGGPPQKTKCEKFVELFYVIFGNKWQYVFVKYDKKFRI